MSQRANRIIVFVGVVIGLGGWIVFPIGYDYFKKVTMSDKEKREIEIEKQAQIQAKINYRYQKDRIEKLCGIMPNMTESVGSSGDRFTEGDEGEIYVDYDETIESYWMECVSTVLKRKDILSPVRI